MLRSTGFALLKLALQALHCIIPHHAAAGQDKHARRQTSSEKPPPAGSNLAFLQLPLHSDDWQNQLRPRRLTLHHLR